MLKKIIITLSILTVALVLFFAGKIWFPVSEDRPAEPVSLPVIEEQATVAEEPKAKEPMHESPPGKVPGSSYVAEVPFIVQAPFGEWSDTRFQNACEEASLIMAAYWRTGKPLTKEIGKQEILDLVKFQEKRFGTAVDTSLEDTQKILEEYYSIKDAEIVYDILPMDIVQALQKGNVVILPADGRKLKNPNFTQPGPPRHMLVVIGYDARLKEFITNDPGTRSGKDYHYKEDVLYDAILHYPTGDHAPVKSTQKVMLVVPKSVS